MKALELLYPLCLDKILVVKKGFIFKKMSYYDKIFSKIVK